MAALGGDELVILQVTLAIIIGTLAAIVYSLRVLVLMERRIARMDENLERVVSKVASEEFRIEKAIKLGAPKKAKKKKR